MLIELRRYALHPGAREDLISLFDREFLESQDEVGAVVLGQFRDLDDPDRFVWLRGFASMAARRAALEAFYGGPVWTKHRRDANRTMVAWDDVLLLRTVTPFTPDTGARPPVGAPSPDTVLRLTVRYADAPFDTVPEVPSSLLTLVSADEENDYPALPVRTGEHVAAALTRDAFDPATLPPGRTEHLRLAPTGRSWLR
ncbi:NIPSNAP family protein [Catenuloplanes sp. NPDC051500]|uniref:NIPSNAP family protein n=1 Tax=Catenuloplanes sp. NPDC051500 TaxID=3363959 RepID=UPI0037BC2E27